jgi:hypothetical protein
MIKKLLILVIYFLVFSLGAKKFTLTCEFSEVSFLNYTETGFTLNEPYDLGCVYEGNYFSVSAVYEGNLAIKIEYPNPNTIIRVYTNNFNIKGNSPFIFELAEIPGGLFIKEFFISFDSPLCIE